MPVMFSVSCKITIQPVLPMLCSKWGESGTALDFQKILYVRAMALGSLTTKYSDHFLMIKISNQNHMTIDQASRNDLVTQAEAGCQGVGSRISAQGRKADWVKSEASFNSQVCVFIFKMLVNSSYLKPGWGNELLADLNFKICFI